MHELQHTADYWDARRARPQDFPTQWWDLPAVLRYRNQRLSGDPERGLDGYVARELGHRWQRPNVLVLGCGDGELERRLAAQMQLGEVLGLDIAAQGLAAARAAAATAGLSDFRYELADLNTVRLPARQFDLVLCAGVLHHLNALEHVFAQMARALRPGGLLVVDEYVGANRFQFSRAQRRRIVEAFRELPASLRRARVATTANGGMAALPPRQALTPRALWSKLRSGQLVQALRYRLSLLRAAPGEAPVLRSPRIPSALDVQAGDPSEAVRSAEILPLLEREFTVLERRGLGFAVLQFGLAGIAHNFLGAGAESERALARMIERDRADGLADDFVLVVGAPKDSA